MCFHLTWYILKFKTWYIVYITVPLILFISTNPVEFKQVVNSKNVVFNVYFICPNISSKKKFIVTAKEVLKVLSCQPALTTHPHIAPRLKKEKSYTSTPPLGLHGLLKGALYLYLYLPVNSQIFHSKYLHWIINFTKSVNFLLSLFYLFMAAPVGEQIFLPDLSRPVLSVSFLVPK
jgi:hypothetical protein